jgi:hypothetical protein
LKKPTLYLDTSIISAYWYDGGEIAMMARWLHTREWWDLERTQFTLWSSAFSEAELKRGTFARQRDCLKMVRRIRYLSATMAVKQLIDEIMRRKLVPPNKPGDAAQLAISAAHGIDYLLTWNYAHLANPIVQASLDRLCVAEGLTAPLLVSPESIPQVRFGQSIRRKR